MEFTWRFSEMFAKLGATFQMKQGQMVLDHTQTCTVHIDQFSYQVTNRQQTCWEICWPHRAGFDDAWFYSASYQKVCKGDLPIPEDYTICL